MNGLVFSPNTPDWAKIRSIEYSYQTSLIANNPDYLRRFIVSTQAMQTQALMTANTQLAEVNKGILGIQDGITELNYAMQDGFNQLGDQLADLNYSIQDGFSALAVEMQQQNQTLQSIAQLLSKKLEGEAREIRNSALAAVKEGCSPEAFDQEGSLQEALKLFNITVEHPMGMRDYVAWFNIGWLQWKVNGNLEEAEKAFATTVRQSMEIKDAYHVLAARHLAYMRYLQKKTDGAYQGIKLALQTSADNPENLFTLLLISAQAGNIDELKSNFRTLISNHPEYLANCLAENDLNAYQTQLQPVIDDLIAIARNKSNNAIERIKDKISYVKLLDDEFPYATLFSDQTKSKLKLLFETANQVNTANISWQIMHGLQSEIVKYEKQLTLEFSKAESKIELLRSIEWIHIPAGNFIFGEAKINLCLNEFLIAKHPITVAQYRLYCQSSGKSMPEEPRWGWNDDHPMVNVSWDDAKAFCDFYGYRLPTEEEWEKAARGTEGREFPWGSVWDMNKCVNKDNSPNGTQSVGKYPYGASPYGCMDMAGNVLEWTDSWYDNSHKSRVLRGGSWDYSSTDSFNFRCAYRNFSYYPSSQYDICGFRVAR